MLIYFFPVTKSKKDHYPPASAFTQSTQKTFANANRLTRVTIQLWVNNVDFSVFLRFFCRLCRPGAGDQVIGTPVLLQANKVEGNSAELSRPTALQKHRLVVVWDISVKTKHRCVQQCRRRSSFVSLRKTASKIFTTSYLSI